MSAMRPHSDSRAWSPSWPKVRGCQKSPEIAVQPGKERAALRSWGGVGLGRGSRTWCGIMGSM
eukprot:1502748-Heterocapsa_arctica.AAC.1